MRLLGVLLNNISMGEEEEEQDFMLIRKVRPLILLLHDQSEYISLLPITLVPYLMISNLRFTMPPLLRHLS